MHLEILDDKRIDILSNICGHMDLENFYLAGGTALSLQHKLRFSYDFDFFSSTCFNADSMLTELRTLFGKKIDAERTGPGTCEVIINGVQVSFSHYPYDMCKDFVLDREMENLKMASPEDIAAMKMSAIGSRGAKKDFFDLYGIMNILDGFGACGLLRCAGKKFGRNADLSYMIMGMDYFDDAESEVLPKTFVKYDWNEIKEFFISIKQDLIKIVEADFE